MKSRTSPESCGLDLELQQNPESEWSHDCDLQYNRNNTHTHWRKCQNFFLLLIEWQTKKLTFSSPLLPPERNDDVLLPQKTTTLSFHELQPAVPAGALCQSLCVVIYLWLLLIFICVGGTLGCPPSAPDQSSAVLLRQCWRRLWSPLLNSGCGRRSPGNGPRGVWGRPSSRVFWVEVVLLLLLLWSHQCNFNFFSRPSEL